MKTNQLRLTKSQLAETIISTLSLNKLGYKFFKSNYRHYYFKRETPNEAVTDIMVICVYFRRGRISCNLQSRIDNKMSNSAKCTGIDRNAYLSNSKFDLNTKWNFGGPWMGDYCFNHSIDSLSDALHLLLSDLEVQGSILTKDFDDRSMHPKFLCALRFIKQIDSEKKILIEQINSDIISNLKKAHHLRRLKSETDMLIESLKNELMEQLAEIEEKMESQYYYDFRKEWRKQETTNKALACEAVGFILTANRKNANY